LGEHYLDRANRIFKGKAWKTSQKRKIHEDVKNIDIISYSDSMYSIVYNSISCFNVYSIERDSVDSIGVLNNRIKTASVEG